MEMPVRLADRLAGARIISPLTEVAAADSLAALGEVRTETVLAVDFEDFDPASTEWTQSDRAEIQRTDDGSAFLLRELSQGDTYGWVLPAEPGAYYEFERRARAESPVAADFAVVESSETGDVGGRSMPGRDQAIKIHWPARPEPDGTWQADTFTFFTTAETRALVVMARPAMNALDMPDDGVEAWFDDLRLERIFPTPAQEIALVKARALAPGADPELGIDKYGQFPPLGAAEGRHTNKDANFSYRRALYAPPPTELEFPLRLPKNASLRFSVTLARETRPGHAARFEVLVRDGGELKSLWTKVVAAEPEQWHWHDARIDLAALAGREVELVLRTEPTAGTPHPMWGHPVIDVPPDGDGPRNVILIAVDTLRADRLSCYGYRRDTTPHMDALAADGVRFEQVAANANWTCPSFASIFTGVVPSRHGVFSLGPTTPLPATFVTVAERFRDHGWMTNSIIYKAPLYDGGYEQGFDIAFNVPRENVRGSDNLAEAMQWLDTSSDRRNFLFLHFNDPHQPFTQPEPFDTRFGPINDIELPHSLVEHGAPKDRAQQQVMRDLYDGEVAYVDACIGEFVEALRARDLYDSSYIVLVSDHGEELWEHGAFGHGGAMLHDTVARVPLIIKPAAGDAQRGVTVRTQVRAFDVMPTLLEIAGIPVEDDLDAKTLTPLMAPGAPQAADRFAFIESSVNAIAARSSRWKYILRYGDERRPREQLFDLHRDPNEWRNIERAQRGQVRRMRLRTLDYILRHRPGQYVVAIGESGGPEQEFEVGGANSATAIFGIPPSTADGGRVVFRGPSAGRLLAVARIELDPAATPDREVRRYTRGELIRLLASGEAGVHLLDGPPDAIDEAPEHQTMDGRQLEALRGVGYVGDGK